MELYLVRHGIAEEALTAYQAGKGDADRALTPEGREKTARVARAFSRTVSNVSLILHSPYLRARETAEIFAGEFKAAKLAEAEGLRPHDPPAQGLSSIQAARPTGNLMVVGHEPHLGMLTSLLLTGHEDASIEFKKAGIAGFEYGEAGYARLLFLLPPRALL